ncbi:MAG: N-acetylneuraminate synthase family protein [Ignavibacteriaceae bacterium]|nr:N-acetylneuraminate synthase family protein [Ignavibacteriaceae bacterium]
MKQDRRVKVGNISIGDGEPVFIIAEIGINHNGSVAIAKKMIEGAAFAGCNAVKFQKRTPELCVPRDQWEIERDTPWGRMTYIDYRHKMEFDQNQYDEIISYCKEKGITWFASCWDDNAVDFIEHFNPRIYKIASASLTDDNLLTRVKQLGKPVILSTGMSSLNEIERAIEILDTNKLLLAQSTSSYPCKNEELNIKVIQSYRDRYPSVPVGYSGHETGLAPTLAAVSIGANFVERHITLDRAMWGTDQAASVEMVGLMRLVANIRDIEKALGDGVKCVYQSELPQKSKLRKTHSELTMVRAV